MPDPKYLSPTAFIDSDADNIIAFAQDATKGEHTDLDKAVALYYRVRDDIAYNLYLDYTNLNVFKASWTLDKGEGFCTPKSAILAAGARSLGIPARLGFADVKNHITTQRMREYLGTDIMPWHAYTELYLEGKWVKATPAFNLALCQKFKIKPLDFNGREDSIFHPFNEDGDRHMEYIKDRGTFADVPHLQIMKTIGAMIKATPDKEFLEADFGAEGAAETG